MVMIMKANTYEMKNYLSIDIGGTNLKYALLDNAGNIIEKGKTKSPHENKIKNDPNLRE